MTLQEVKALARSPQNNWVFNSSRVVPLKVSEDCAISKSLLVARLPDLEKPPDFSFNCCSPEKVKNSGLLLDKVIVDRSFSGDGKEFVVTEKTGPVMSPSFGLVNVPVQDTSGVDCSLYPSTFRKPSQLPDEDPCAGLWGFCSF